MEKSRSVLSERSKAAADEFKLHSRDQPGGCTRPSETTAEDPNDNSAARRRQTQDASKVHKEPEWTR